MGGRLVFPQVVRSGQKVAAKKASGAHKQGGFFSGFFARKPKKEEHDSEESKETKGRCLGGGRRDATAPPGTCADPSLSSSGSALDGIMTAEEKGKLYAAIGYSESSHNLALPKQVRREGRVLATKQTRPFLRANAV